MELISLEEFISSGRIYVVLLAVVVVSFMFRVYFNVKNGAYYYNQYPMAKAMDEMAKTGELKDKDIVDAIRNIDDSASKEERSAQFKTNIHSQRE